MGIEWTNADELLRRADELILHVDVVLDVGCGIRPQPFVKPKVLVCLDAHEEYLEVVRDALPGTRTVIMQGLVPGALRLMPSNSVDTVFMLDFVEHIEKEDGLAAIAEARRIARRQVIVFTPIGFMPQDHAEGELDGWGLHGGDWQKHRSGWAVTDFGDDWHVVGCEDYHKISGSGEAFEKPFGAMWAVLTKPEIESGSSNDESSDTRDMARIEVLEKSIKARDESMFTRDQEARGKLEAVEAELTKLREMYLKLQDERDRLARLLPVRVYRKASKLLTGKAT